jgi:glycosyltransferase involved in cell wall biosynthesis
MTKSPDISVVMSVYNGSLCLGETIESILTQDNVDFEFIIVNDGSTDISGAILREYARRDKRVRVFEQENQGLTKSLIRGCAEARGEYIARQDAGDISLPTRLALQKAALDADDTLSFVSCWTEYVGPEWEFLYLVKGTGIASSPTCTIAEQQRQGLTDGPTSHPSVMFRTDCYLKAGGYRPQFYFGQDWDLWYRLAQIGKFQMLPQSLYRAKVMPSSISGSYKKLQDAIAKLSFATLQRRLNGVSEEDVLREAGTIRPPRGGKEKSWTRAAWLYFIGECLRKNRDSRAFSYLRRSVMANPFYARSWVRIIQIMLNF